MCDNSSTIKLSKNPVMHGRSKHIDVRFHFLRDLTKEEVVKLVHCGTNDQVADILTKPLKLEVFLNTGLPKGSYDTHGNMVRHRILGNVELRQTVLILGPRFSHGKFIERPPLGPLLVGSLDPCGGWMVRALHHVPISHVLHSHLLATWLSFISPSLVLFLK
ncbi:hypothetical protein PVL29_011523 [Vitis rotundifolia]|uniref:Uncharacterized protein n=1 Tax=Vitis rotundifolia TaxID=103349 RepID=A0AA38ZPA8_VITRO|nr:hypothetical protein PVL29_011523 [Vitis rotundifolia]